MIICLHRIESTPKYTVGKVYVDGKFICYSLEDPFHEKKIKGRTRIPSGSYQVLLRFSPKFSPRLGHSTLWVTDVPNYEYILFHPGNTVDDTDGCILVGRAHSKGVLSTSRPAYFDLYETVNEAAKKKELWLTIIE